MKNKPKKISIALDPEILKKLDDGSLTGIERAKAIASIIKG